MNTIIQIWNLFFNYVFSDNGFLVAFGFAALGILTAITAALLFLIPIMLLRSFFTWISLYIPDSVSKHYKNRTWVAVAWYILAFFLFSRFLFFGDRSFIREAWSICSYIVLFSILIYRIFSVVSARLMFQCTYKLICKYK